MVSKTLAGFIALAVGADRGRPGPGGGRIVRAAPRAAACDVVAAENFYGNIAAQIGGSHVRGDARSCTDPNADPHLSSRAPGTASPSRRRALVIQNGVGYDSFMQKLEAAAPSSHRVVVTIAGVLGVTRRRRKPAPVVRRAQARPDRRGDRGGARAGRPGPPRRPIARASRRFEASLAPLDREVASIRARVRGHAGRLHRAGAGLPARRRRPASLTPAAFARAIEDGSEPSPAGRRADDRPVHRPPRAGAALQQPDRLPDHRPDPRRPPRSAGIPVVGVSETLPPGLTFQAWQLEQARALERALDR